MATWAALAASALGAVLLAACGGGGSDAGVSDFMAPTAALTAPQHLADGLTGVLALSATASDNVGVASVEFQVDGIAMGMPDTTAPYEASVDTAAHAGGQHVVRTRSRDEAGNVSPWSSATVRLGGSAGVTQGFTKDESWVTGLSNATAFAQAPDGRLFIAQQGGAIRVFKNGMLLPTAFHQFTVDASGERGLIGITLDPDFTAIQRVYVHYTTTSGGTHNRISRLVANGDVSTGVETVLVNLPNLSAATNHNGGAIHFGIDGMLYAGVGDNANGALSQDPGHPFGKLLRINPNSGIATVWALGLRNPFTFAVQPVTGRIHINDVGEATWEEINVGAEGANYGWPGSEGQDNITAGVTAPLFAYKHSDASPAGSGPGGFFTGFSIAGGAFYPDGGSFPAAYRGNYFFADFVSRWIARRDPANGDAAYAFASVAGNPVDMLAGNDGALYVLTRGGVTRISSP